MITENFDVAKAEYVRLFPDSPFFETWIPRSNFLAAEFDGVGNLSVSREDSGIYGVAFGNNPKIPTGWKNFSLESRGAQSLTPDCKVVAEWDSYWAPTTPGVYESAGQSSDEAIEKFLKEHAPDSSVFPGNNEILQWIEIHEETELVAIAALCRWQSGGVVISSVATHGGYRGMGHGKELINRCLIVGSHLGEQSLSLGVRHNNESGQRLYASTGFTLMHNFTYCERR
jgi:ribosomal protein S18 acetylase RimI-like enzyme